MKDSIKEDRQLLSRLFSGGSRASEQLILRFSDLVYRTIQYTLLAKNVFFTREDLKDYHNTIFLHLFENRCKKLRQYKGKNGCSLASWIRLISVRTVLDHLRRKNNTPITSSKTHLPLEHLPELRSTEDNAEGLLEKSESKQLLKAAIDQLSPREQVFMKLHIEKELSVFDTAQIMQISPGSAYTLKHRTIQKLRSCLENKPHTNK